MPVMRRLLPGIRVTEHIAIPERSSGKLHPERESARIETAYHDHRGYPQHVDPTGGRVRPFAELAVLGHGFINRRHLNGRIHISIQVEAIECLEIHRQSALARTAIIALGLWIGLEKALSDLDVAELGVRRF